MNLVLDTSLSPRLARLLDAALGPAHRVVHATELAEQATDRMIADHVAAHAPALIIGMDLDVTAHPHRMAALKEMGAAVALLTTDWLTHDPVTQSWMLLRLMPRLLKKAQVSANPILLVSPGNGGSIRKA